MATAAAGSSKKWKQSVLTLETKLEIVHALEKGILNELVISLELQCLPSLTFGKIVRR